MFLHQILLPDGDPYPHSHPFSSSISLILKGGYTEYRGIYGDDERTYRAGKLNRISGTDVHRIDRMTNDEPVWTLFYAGKPHGRGWGFYVDGVYIDHKEYLAAR